MREKLQNGEKTFCTSLFCVVSEIKSGFVRDPDGNTEQNFFPPVIIAIQQMVRQIFLSLLFCCVKFPSRCSELFHILHLMLMGDKGIL